LADCVPAPRGVNGLCANLHAIPDSRDSPCPGRLPSEGYPTTRTMLLIISIAEPMASPANRRMQSLGRQSDPAASGVGHCKMT
jgi:hypothetical protein